MRILYILFTVLLIIETIQVHSLLLDKITNSAEHINYQFDNNGLDREHHNRYRHRHDHQPHRHHHHHGDCHHHHRADNDDQDVATTQIPSIDVRSGHMTN